MTSNLNALDDPNTVTIVCVIVNTKEATLYLLNGETLTVKQGDARLSSILYQAAEALTYFGASVTVSLAALAPPADTTYQQYEKKSSGFVRLFRVARSALSKILDTVRPEMELEAKTIGVPVEPTATVSVSTPIPVSMYVESSSALAETAARHEWRGAGEGAHERQNTEQRTC